MNSRTWAAICAAGLAERSPGRFHRRDNAWPRRWGEAKPPPYRDRRCRSFRERSWHPSASEMGRRRRRRVLPVPVRWRAFPPEGGPRCRRRRRSDLVLSPRISVLWPSIVTPKGSSRGTPSAKTAISVVVPPMSRAMASLAAAGHGQDPHDAGRGTGKDRLNGKFHGLLDVEGSAVRLQDVDRDVDPPFADKTKDLRDEMTDNGPRSLR